ncbi:hypothetical protein QFZ37_001427 [Chryseobacterium ginsenosidimutans]|nr:hypothetical protein [Chryseobacterium ginsenosidimutans]
MDRNTKSIHIAKLILYYLIYTTLNKKVLTF